MSHDVDRYLGKAQFGDSSVDESKELEVGVGIYLYRLHEDPQDN